MFMMEQIGYIHPNSVMKLNVLDTSLTLFIVWSIILEATSLFQHDTASPITVEDDFLTKQTLSTPILFHGTSQKTIYLSENGMVTFDNGFYGGNTFPLTKTWIAPFGADVAGYIGEMKHQTFKKAGSTELTTASDLVNEIYSSDNFVATSVFVVTWYNVQKYSLTAGTDENIFQLALATDGSGKTYAIFLYEKIEWYPAQIGASAGDESSFFRVCDTDKYGSTFLPTKSNSQCATAGVIVFRLDQSTWIQPGYTCTPVYTPIRCSAKPGNAEENRDKRCSAR